MAFIPLPDDYHGRTSWTMRPFDYSFSFHLCDFVIDNCLHRWITRPVALFDEYSACFRMYPDSKMLADWQQNRSHSHCKTIAICVRIWLRICRQSLPTCYASRLAAEIEQTLLFCTYLNCDINATEKSLKMMFLFLYIFILRVILNMIIKVKNK